MHRVLDHYLHTCHGAARLIFPGSVADLAADLAPGTAPERLPERGQALAWCQAERRVLMAAVAAAGGGGFDTHAWQIPWTLAAFLDLHGYWHDYQDSQQIALAAARREGNAAAMARAQRHLGGAMARLGRHHDARLHQEQALGTYRGLRDDAGQARVHSDIAWVLELQGSYHEALAHARQSLGLFQAAGHSAGQARALQMTG